MAYEDNLDYPDTQDRPPTPEEIRAAQLTEEAKRNAIAGTVNQMNALETTALVPPGNRTYIGPNVGDPRATPRQFFGDVPSGAVINRMPLLPPGGVPGAAGRVAAMTNAPLPPDPGLTAVDPGVRKFAAQQQIQRAMAGGMPAADALRTFGSEFFLPPTGGRRYNVGGLGLVDEAGNVVAPAPARAPRPINVAGVGLVEPETGKVIVPTQRKVTPTQAVTNRHKVLMAEELAAKQGDDPRKANQARYAREAFEQEHPELGLSVVAPSRAAIPAPVGRSAAAPNEVIRHTKDGRRAVFDSRTKQFLRYAD